jgi:O-antigen ligase
MPTAVFAPIQLSGLLVLTALGCAIAARNRQALFPPLARRIAWLLSALCIWAVISTIWAVDARLGLLESARFTGTAIAGIIVLGAASTLGPKDRTNVCRALILGTAIGYTLFALEIATEGLILRTASAWISDGKKRFIFSVAYNRATSVIALLSWPILLLLLRRRAWLAAIAVFLVGLGFVIELQKSASTIALLVGGATFALVWVGGRRLITGIAIVIGVAILTSPLLPLTVLEPMRVAEVYPQVGQSESHRLLIWKFVAERINERPLFGWGMNSSRAIPGGKSLVPTEVPSAQSPGRVSADTNMGEQLPLHPHNAPLQLWLELGVIGAVLGGGVVIGALHMCRRRSMGRLESSVAAAAIVSVVAISAMSFSVWQSWWLSIIWLTASFLVAVRTAPLSPAAETESGVRR